MKIPLKNLPVLINGDDILFRSNTELYDIWFRNITEVGFQLSLGKNYIDSSCLTVNSEMFIYDKHKESFEKLKYLNTGLLVGQSKTSKGDDTPIWDIYNKVVHTSANPMRTHNRFLFHNEKKIRKFTSNGQYNLFLPREYGGLGFIAPEGLKYKITSFQSRFAAYYYTTLLEGVRENRVVNHGIKMISKSADHGLTIPHYHEIKLQPSIGPLPENYHVFEADTVLPSLLANRQPEVEIEFILPTERELEKFRTMHPKGLPEKKMKPFRICQVIHTDPLLEGLLVL